MISSPFLLGETINCHLLSYKKEIETKLKNDIYLANIIMSTESEDAALDLYSFSKLILNDVSMNLREWITNSDFVNRHIPDEISWAQ